MEVLVDGATAARFPEGSILSVRCGTSRRQAPMRALAKHPLKFETSLDTLREPIKVDVLSPVGSTLLALRPEKDSYDIKFDSERVDMTLSLMVRSAGQVGSLSDAKGSRRRPRASAEVSPPLQDASAVVEARDFLESSGLLRYLQVLLSAVVQSRPEDPFDYMAKQFQTASFSRRTERNAASEPTEVCPPSSAQAPSDSPVVTAHAGVGEEATPATEADLRAAIGERLGSAAQDGSLLVALAMARGPGPRAECIGQARASAVRNLAVVACDGRFEVAQAPTVGTPGVDDGAAGEVSFGEPSPPLEPSPKQPPAPAEPPPVTMAQPEPPDAVSPEQPPTPEEPPPSAPEAEPELDKAVSLEQPPAPGEFQAEAHTPAPPAPSDEQPPMPSDHPPAVLPPSEELEPDERLETPLA